MEFKYFVCWALIVAGTILYAFWEKPFYKIKTALVYILVTILIVTSIVFGFILPTNSLTWTAFIVVGISLILGIIISCFLVKYETPIAFLYGVSDGFILGLLIHEAALYNSTLVWLLWTICGVLALGGAALTIWFREYIRNLSSSFLGAYLIIRALAVYIGAGYPNEFLSG